MPDHHHHEHDHGAEHHHGHGHAHGVVDPSIASTDRGLWALKWSFIGLMITALLQVVVVVLSNSVALLADTIHNFADAATAIPLGIAFVLVRRGATRRFTYGLGRVEDLAGLAIVITIAVSAVVAFYQAGQRFLHPQPVGFLADGWTSLAVLLGAIGVWAGYPLADPVVGLLISAAIFVIVWQSARAVMVRMLDGVDAATLETIGHAARHVARVEEVTDLRARWIGHRLHAEVSITVPAGLSVADGHEVAKEVRHQLLHHLPHRGRVMVHVDPYGQGGEEHHRLAEHTHDGLPAHSHE